MLEYVETDKHCIAKKQKIRRDGEHGDWLENKTGIKFEASFKWNLSWKKQNPK